jgi:hypothetical protein
MAEKFANDVIKNQVMVCTAYNIHVTILMQCCAPGGICPYLPLWITPTQPDGMGALVEGKRGSQTSHLTINKIL